MPCDMVVSWLLCGGSHGELRLETAVKCPPNVSAKTFSSFRFNGRTA